MMEFRREDAAEDLTLAREILAAMCGGGRYGSDSEERRRSSSI